jgi:hypothetical protein
MTDRASVVTTAILHIVRMFGTGVEAASQITAKLRDEFQDIQRQTLNEIRPEDE